MSEGLFPRGEAADGGHAEEGDGEAGDSDAGVLWSDTHWSDGESVKEGDQSDSEERNMAEAEEASLVGAISAEPILVVKEEAHNGSTDDAEKHAGPAKLEGEKF